MDENPSAQYVTCHCRHCNGGIEFDAVGFGRGETFTVECPHCHLETDLFVPAQDVPPVLSGESVANEVESKKEQLPTFPPNKGIDEDEELIQQCIEVICYEQKASVSLLQRRLRLGYTRAALIMDELESRGIVGPSKGAEPRDILVDLNNPNILNYCRQASSGSLFELAQNGDRECQYLVGMAYINGDGVSKNAVEAIKWVRKAAEQGHPKAQAILGEAFHSWGKFDESVKWYRSAAEQGEPDAQFRLGVIYGFGQGVPKNGAEAVKWYRLAAENGHPVAQNNLGVVYDHGEGLPMNKAEAVKWYQMAADQSDPDAQFNLGLCYSRGEGVTKDFVEAAKLWRKAAEQGHAVAQFGLGCCYRDGEGVTKDLIESLKWYRLAAEQGHAPAQLSLGIAFSHGDGAKKDYMEAVRWYRLAAEQGDNDACRNLGVAYALGEGVPQDFVEAYKWTNLSAASGDEQSKQLRDSLTQQMTPTQIEEGQRRASIEAKNIRNPTNHTFQQRQERAAIPSEVRREVWRRDGGTCVKCGSRKNLEYDHIVPVSKGGSNTARNIELLCESCNRSKSASIQ